MRRGISAKIIEVTQFLNGVNLLTFELRLPTIVLAELNTHRAFSRNASSARAIPFKIMKQNVLENPFIPYVWTSNKPGMQGEVITDMNKIDELRHIWKGASKEAVKYAEMLVVEANVHKQVANRLLTPFMWSDVVMTAMEEDLGHFLSLRMSDEAEPHMNILAEMIDKEMANINYSDHIKTYHIPYILDSERSLPIETQLKISVARCARVSYKLFNGLMPSIKKDIELYDKLFELRHLSPFEHQAWGIEDYFERSGNFHGCIQHRKSLGV